MAKGFILTSKSLVDSDIWRKPPLYLKVWMYLLINACYSDHGNLKRGQIRTSIPEIQDACTYFVGYRKVKPTYKEVRDVIDYLRDPHEITPEGKHEGQTKGSMIVTTKVTHGFIATICKYDEYQTIANYEGHSEGHNESSAKDERRATQGHNKKNEYITNNTKELLSYSDSDHEKGQVYRDPATGRLRFRV